MPRVFESTLRPDGVYIPTALEYYMNYAFDLALISKAEGFNPIGAVIAGLDRVYDPSGNSEMILGEGRNRASFLRPLDHAVPEAISQAVSRVGRAGLSEAVLVLSHEGCVMCAGSVANTKLAGVVCSTTFDDVNFSGNEVRMQPVIVGRAEKGVHRQFFQAGFLYEQGLEILQS